MRLEIDASLPEFLKQVKPSLEKEPAIHSMLLSLAERYQQLGKPTSLLARGLRPDGTLAIAALQTESERPVIVSKASTEDAALFAQALAAQGSSLPGVNGPNPTVDVFAEAWSLVKTCKTSLGLNLRLFELTAVQPPRPAPGSFRPARPEDDHLIFQWLRAFHDEAVPHDPHTPDEELYRNIRDAIQHEQFYFWEDQNQVVCMVGARRETSRERWIAPVYTPPHLRGRGYASCLVAAVSEKIVATGKRGMLFTDLANPTSNSIYQKVGYVPLADFKHVIFT